MAIGCTLHTPTYGLLRKVNTALRWIGLLDAFKNFSKEKGNVLVRYARSPHAVMKSMP